MRNAANRGAMELQMRIEDLPLRFAFRISGYTFTSVPVIHVSLTQDGIEGRGEAAGVYYLQDTPARMFEQLQAQREVVEAGVTREELRDLLPPGGARNALDCALWELESRRARQPVWRLAGLDGVTPRITTFTLSADEPEIVARNAQACAAARALKLKLSGECELDGQRVRAVRAARPDVWLGVDANQGYTRDSLEKLMPVLLETRVQLIEQPLPRGQEEELDGYTSPIALAADESVQDLNEIGALAGRFDVVNIKLDKCGGLTEALLMAQHARQLGLKLMVGNMIGTSLAMAPAFVLGQLCDFVDLDGPTFLSADCAPGVVYRNGEISCTNAVWGAPEPAALSLCP